MQKGCWKQSILSLRFGTFFCVCASTLILVSGDGHINTNLPNDANLAINGHNIYGNSDQKIQKRGPIKDAGKVTNNSVEDKKIIAVSSGVTDSEVSDLIHRTNPSTLSPNNNNADISLDKIVVPDYNVKPNSRFNIATGGIAAFLCLIVAVGFYVAIMIWQNMSGYNNREILLNDDDIGLNDDDILDFETACIRIEG